MKVLLFDGRTSQVYTVAILHSARTKNSISIEYCSCANSQLQRNSFSIFCSAFLSLSLFCAAAAWSYLLWGEIISFSHSYVKRAFDEPNECMSSARCAHWKCRNRMHTETFAYATELKIKIHNLINIHKFQMVILLQNNVLHRREKRDGKIYWRIHIYSLFLSLLLFCEK